jgi:Rhodopirellula transposase DDE domain
MIDKVPKIAEDFRAVLGEHTAGSPVESGLIWTDLTATEIAQRMTERGTSVSVHVVEQLLDEHDYHRRKAQKDVPMGESPDRDAQFRNIAQWRQQFQDAGDPVLSIDTKKRELIGNFYRPGTLLTQQTQRTFDHDFPSFADGVVIPHGLYDVQLNRGYVHLGTSHDTSAFACDCLEDWWVGHGRTQYPGSRSVLLLADGGGSNSASTYLFKADLQGLADKLGVEFRVAHYPPYCSKYNPIEHRLFCHLSRACQGVVFSSVALVKRLMEKAQTRTGLRVVVDVIGKVYETGRRIAEEAKKALNLIRDSFLPKWNYRILPHAGHQ